MTNYWGGRDRLALAKGGVQTEIQFTKLLYVAKLYSVSLIIYKMSSSNLTVNISHSNPLTSVCLEKRGRIPTQRLTIDNHEGQMYYQGEANAREVEVEELLAPENQVFFGLEGIGPRLPIHRRASERMLIHIICRLQKLVKFLEELIYDILVEPTEPTKV